MGQSSIQLLNKRGVSMFWESMWDSKKNYNILSKENYFIKKFIKTFYNDLISPNIFKKYKCINNFNKFKIIKNKKEVFQLFLKKKPLNYTSKVWFLKFQKWLVVYNYVYIIKKQKFLYKNNNSIFKKNYLNYINLFFIKYKIQQKFVLKNF